MLAQIALPFTKMQALGNDFVVIGAGDLAIALKQASLADSWLDAAPAFTRAVCDRHYGIGADGLIIGFDQNSRKDFRHIFHELEAGYPEDREVDVSWIYINGDGSRSAMCGNGLRCFILWCVNNGFVARKDFRIGTMSGAVQANFANEDEVSVELAAPALDARKIPLHSSFAKPRFLRESLKDAGAAELAATCVSMGNPHCVIFDDRFAQHSYADPELAGVAEKIQASSLFPEGVNVGFATTIGRDRARVLVWERGCGPTLACASGAAAVLVAGVLEERMERTAQIDLPGGALRASWNESGTVTLIGPARESFRGTADLRQFVQNKNNLTREACC